MRTPILLVLPLAAALAAAPAARAQGVRLADAGAPSARRAAAPAAAARLGSERFAEVCVSDPAGEAGVRTVRMQVQPETGDTFVEVERRMLPIGVAFPPRGYAGRLDWFRAGSPVTHAGRNFLRTTEVRRLGPAGVEAAGAVGAVRLFRPRGGAATELLVPVRPGCDFQVYRARTPPAAELRPGARRGSEYAVPFGTNREATGRRAPDLFFGTGDGGLQTGVARVSIPPEHRLGRMERPGYLSLSGSDPRKHVMLTGELRVPAPPGGRRPVLVFIHGYNTSFPEAAWRAAQLAHDLGFQGSAVFFSWPSQGSLRGYDADATMVRRTRGEMAAFLGALVAEHRPEDLYVVVHSMGNRLFGQAVEDVRERVPGRLLFNTVVLAAPDQDVKVFVEDDLPDLVEAAQRVAVYTSGSDRALWASSVVNGFGRAGASAGEVAAFRRVQVVDTGGGHSSFAEDPVVLGDIHLLLRGRKPAQRNLVRMTGPRGQWWRVRQN
jgi:esterase/lipase superfamily enzyme